VGFDAGVLFDDRPKQVIASGAWVQRRPPYSYLNPPPLKFPPRTK